MASINQLCAYSQIVFKYLNHSEKDKTEINQTLKKVYYLCKKCPKTLLITNTIGLDLDQELVANGSEQQSDKVIVDLLICLLSLLNNYNECELISSSDLLTIQLSIIKLISLTIIPYIEQHFQQINLLFLNSKLSVDSVDNQLSIHFIQKLCKVLKIFLSNKESLIWKFVCEHTLAPLLAAMITAKHETKDITQKASIDEDLNQFLSNSNRILIIRNLLLLTRCKPSKHLNSEISRSLSLCLTHESGLNCLIAAVLDSDQTSQKETTLNQRYQAIGTIVSSMPVLCCSLSQYYQTISQQLFHLLLNPNPIHWEIGSMIVICLENRNKKLTQELFYAKLINIFILKDNRHLIIDNAIEIVHRLINHRIDSKKFISIVPHLFFIRVILEETLSHYKSLLNNILKEVFNSSKGCVYLLDNILYNYNHLIHQFEIHVNDGVIGVKFIENSKPMHSDSSQMKIMNEEDMDIKQIDIIVQFVIAFIDQLSQAFRLDFFLLLIERMTFSSPSLLTCSIVDSLSESVYQNIIEHSQKSIQFVSTIFQRLSLQSNAYNQIPNDNQPDLVSDPGFDQIKQTSLTICLQIIKLLLNEKQKLREKDIFQLKEMKPYFEIISKSYDFDECSRKTAKDLKNQIELFVNPIKILNTKESENEFDLAMIELNDHLMPVRAHALIRLKQLICAKDQHILENKSQVINALKMCLNDKESYIYLSAIRTLSSLSIICTDDVLPILVQQFGDSERTLEDRVKVGEVLVQLSKFIGDYAHHYSKQFIHCFLTGVKSEEPMIRISSFSNLGQFCGVLKYSLKSYIVELISCIESILKTDQSIEVKRSAVMFLHLMLRGIDNDLIETVENQLKTIYKLLRLIYSTTIDDVLQLHSQLAIEEMDRIAKVMLTLNQDLTKNIKILSL